MEMMDTNRELLESAYMAALAYVDSAREGGEKAEWNRKKLETLHKMRMDELEALAKAAEREQQKKSEWIKFGIDTGVKLIGYAGTAGAFLITLKFEETGSVGSRATQLVSEFQRLFKK